MKRNIGMVILFGLFTLMVSSSVVADDGRINRAPYHFGGNTLYCVEDGGCTLLDMNGNFLANWPESDIGAAFTLLETSGQSAKVGDVQGTYGIAQLWAVPTGETNGNKRLCLIGFDEWGKLNDMCFAATLDNHYEQAELPPITVVDADGNTVVSVADCSMWTVGNFVRLITSPMQWGTITLIDTANGTATFGIYTYACNLIEYAL